MRPLGLLLCVALGADSEPLVDATARVPGLAVDLRYATSDNFLGRKVYPDSARCLLRASAADRLAGAAAALRRQGFALKVYDCYRSLSVQWEMWKVFPKPGYVADPRTGSNHNRGAAVDLTLVRLDGGPVEMPTPFDTFSAAAHHAFDGGTRASRQHREALCAAMEDAGFKKNPMEWWHYDLAQAASYPVLDEPFADAGRP